MQFQKTIGHKKQKEIFKRAVENNALAHAYCFNGPENIGKTTFAVDLARALGADPVYDLFVYDDEQIKIEQVRDLQSKIRLKSSTAGFKVAVVCYADEMNESAANALLKVLEEPSGGTVLILTTTNFNKLLPTVRSRVQKIQFSITSDETVREILQKTDIDREKFDEIISYAQGRPGLALKLAEKNDIFELFQDYQQLYQSLNSKSLKKRLLAAEQVSEFEREQTQEAIKYFMMQWMKASLSRSLGKELLISYKDINANLNKKLTIDNLFIRNI